jgi:Zn-dependent protease with chaperone function
LPAAIRSWLSTTYLLRYIPALAEAMLLSPALLTWMALWTASYAFEAASRERAFPARLAQGLPVHPMPTLPQYLSMQCRHNFYIFAPVLLHGAIVLIGEILGRWIPAAPTIAEYVGVVIVLVLIPWILIRIWSTTSLTGALRDKLDAIASAHRLRFCDIRLWKTHNAVSNAAILGWVPYSRYFLMTDALLESLTDRQIEAVFAHEVGHGVHRHILWYLAAFFGVSALATALGIYWSIFAPAPLAAFAGGDTADLLTIALLGAFLWFGFPFLSHRFEHQADWFASQHIAHTLEALPPQQLAIVFAHTSVSPTNIQSILPSHPTTSDSITLEQYLAGQYPHAEPPAQMAVAAPPAAPATSQTTSLTPIKAGAEVFISALDTIIEVAHRSRERRGWMHPSVNNRIALLRQLARSQAAAILFNRRMLRTRIIISVVVAAGVIAATHALRLDQRSHEIHSHPAVPIAPPSPADQAARAT